MNIAARASASMRAASFLCLPLSIAVAAFPGCGGLTTADSESTAAITQAFSSPDAGAGDAAAASDPVPCAGWSYGVLANSGGVILNAGSAVDSYQSGLGAYGGGNVGGRAVVQAATSIVDNGGTVGGTETQGEPGGLSVVAVPASAVNLPLGSATPGSLNINSAAQDITLAPGDYVAANINVNSPGAILISPAGQVRIWVTGNLNLGGNENPNGAPGNLAFLVTSSGWVNLNSNGSLYGLIYAPTSGINVNSAVYGGVVGSSVTLNSGAAVHFDQSSACFTQGPTSNAVPPHQLPPPPNVRGCYAGTWNGWLPVPCANFRQLPPAQQRIPYIGGGQVQLPGYLPQAGEWTFGTAPGIVNPGGLRYGQVETTYVAVSTDSTTLNHTEVETAPPATADQGCLTSTSFAKEYPNNSQPGVSLSIQANTNYFPATTGVAAKQPSPDDAWVQFTVQSVAAPGSTDTPWSNVCIWQNDWTLGKADYDYIPNPVGTSSTPCSSDTDCQAIDPDPVTGQASMFCARSGQNLPPGALPGTCLRPTYYALCNANAPAPQQRELQTYDFESVAGSAFPDGVDNRPDLGMVTSFSWAQTPSPSGAYDYTGLYAVVVLDQYGLGQATNWTTVSGTVFGSGGCTTATFPPGTMVYTSVQAGTCASSATSANPAYPNVTWPGLCPNAATIGSGGGAGDSTANFTDESNNLDIVTGLPAANPSPLAYLTENKFLETHYLASADGTCVGNPGRVYVMDNAQDHGSTPSNPGDQPYWESPDIIVVPSGTLVTKDTLPTDPVVEAGENYDIWVRVHNEFSCAAVNDVRARVWWGDAAVTQPNWQDVITAGPDASNPNWSATKSVAAASYDVIGPIHWTAPGTNVNPHECLLVDIRADQEQELPPTNFSDTPHSFQIAQRNVEIGGQCSWALDNGASTSQLGVSLTTTYASTNQANPGQLYPVGKSDTVKVVFDDPGSKLYAAWNANSPSGCTLTTQPNGGTTGTGSTTITMNPGYSQATVSGATLAASESLSVNATVNPALYSGTTIDLAVTARLSAPGGKSVIPSGATCAMTVSQEVIR